MQQLKVLVTVGTTEFNSLVETFDVTMPSVYVFIQYGNSTPPINVDCAAYVPDLAVFSGGFDLTVCHAGAGTVFGLLEIERRLLVVPNLDRKDAHQLELSNWVKDNTLATVKSVSEIREQGIDVVINEARSAALSKYKKQAFSTERFICCLKKAFTE